MSKFYKVLIGPATNINTGGGGGGVQTVTGDGVGGTAANPVLSFPNKNEIELGNVDNTSDSNKPISNATQSALNDKVNSVTTGEPTGASVIGNIVEISQADYDTAQAAGNLNATTLYLTPNV